MPRRAHELDAAAVCLGDPAHQAQAQPAALDLIRHRRLAAEEGLEDQALLVGIEAGAVVFDGDAHLRPRRRRGGDGHPHPAVVPGVLDGVADQVLHGRLQGAGIAHQRRDVRRHRHLHLDPRLGGVGRRQANGLVHDAVGRQA